MAENNEPKSRLEALAIKIARERAFSGRRDLEKYGRQNISGYIGYCCDNGNLIEAYSLTVQYAEEILATMAGDPKITDILRSGVVIATVLKSMGVISDEFYNEFMEINKTRTDLTHKILRDPELRSKLSASGDHEKKLLNFMSNAEEELLQSIVNKIKKKDKFRDEEKSIFSDILYRRAIEKIDLSKLEKKGFADKLREVITEEVNEILN